MKRLSKIFHALLGVVTLMFVAVVATGRLTWRTLRGWWRRSSKWVRRLMTGFVILIFVGFAALVAYAYYEEEYGWRKKDVEHRRYWHDEYLTDDIVVHTFYDGKCRIYHELMGEYISDEFNWISNVPEGDSVAVYALPHRRGYVNVYDGNIVIDAKANEYSRAWVFSDGLAAVEKDGKIGFINAQNEVVIPFQFDATDDSILYNTGYLFHDGYCVMTNDEGLFGVIDKSGRWVVEPIYDKIWAPENGYRTVIKSNKQGLLDPPMKLIYEAVYDCINCWAASGNFILMKDGRMWQEDSEGNVVQPFMYESMEWLTYPVAYSTDPDLDYEYQLSDYAKYQINQRLGIVNRITGKPVTPAIYSEVEMISHNIFEVCTASGYYLIDTNGNVVNK